MLGRFVHEVEVVAGVEQMSSRCAVRILVPPDAPNHHIVAHIKGEWQKGIVRGKLEAKGWGADLGYFAFKDVPIEEQKEIKAFILNSDELIDNWDYLDKFEGDEYKRRLKFLIWYT